MQKIERKSAKLNDYLHLPYSLLFILWLEGLNVWNLKSIKQGMIDIVKQKGFDLAQYFLREIFLIFFI